LIVTELSCRRPCLLAVYPSFHFCSDRVLSRAEGDAIVHPMGDVVEVVRAIHRRSSTTPDREIALLAARQHGVVTRQQLVEVGLRPSAIEHRLRAMRLHPLHRGVYAVGRKDVSQLGRFMAAALACGPDAVLSHRSAAALWQLRTDDRRTIHVVALRSRHTRRRGIALHLVRTLHADDRASVKGIPVTSVPRTLLDLAEVVRSDVMERALEQAERLQLFDLRAVDELLERSHGRRGLGVLKRALAAYREPAAVTRSELERRFLDLCRDAGLPTPAVNTWVAGQEVDMVWPQQRLVVELDSRTYHQTRAAFDRDRIRDEALQIAGYRVLRVTARRLDTDAAAVIGATRSLLS
jgi:uncharacterized protein DUF559/putative AbiEi antitoxin of type IV toxin-antitoxin system